MDPLGGVTLDDTVCEVVGNGGGIEYGDVYRRLDDLDPVVAVEDTRVGESLADVLAAFALDGNTGNAHRWTDGGEALNAGVS